MPRVVQFEKNGGPEVLQLVDTAVTEPKANEVRIKVKALGLNRAEAMFRSGQYLEKANLPAKLGYEAAGTVDAVGAGVSHVKVGDAVSVVPGFSMNQYGLYGEVVVAPAPLVVKHASNLSFEEAAATWMAYVTAFDGLIETAKLQAGEFVVIPAASSSVGIAAIQVANKLKAIPIALTRKSDKKDALLKAGAKYVVATEEQDLVAEINKITGGKGANVVYDPVGGATFAKLVEASAQGARLVLYGALATTPTEIPLLPLISKLPTITSSVIMTTSCDPKKLKVAIDFVNEGLSEGSLKPVIAKTFPLDQIVEAHKYLESNQQFGKIVVTV
ncbi:MAG TPA: zinc-dependent alcohol dehydrogenase family protein [Oculatellaceae cyanobacterium]